MKKKIVNKPSKMAIRANDLYETDFSKWAHTQASLLKRGEFDKLDIRNLGEEIESLGRSEKRSLKHHIENWMLHKLKKEYQPKKQTVSWDLSIYNASAHANEILEDNPSLKPKLQEIFYSSYNLAKNSTAIETGLSVNTFPEECPWKLIDLFPNLEKKYRD